MSSRRTTTTTIYRCLGYTVLDYQPETWVNTQMFRSWCTSLFQGEDLPLRRLVHHGWNICVFTHIFTLVIENRVSHMLWPAEKPPLQLLISSKMCTLGRRGGVVWCSQYRDLTVVCQPNLSPQQFGIAVIHSSYVPAVEPLCTFYALNPCWMDIAFFFIHPITYWAHSAVCVWCFLLGPVCSFLYLLILTCFFSAFCWSAHSQCQPFSAPTHQIYFFVGTVSGPDVEPTFGLAMA